MQIKKYICGVSASSPKLRATEALRVLLSSSLKQKGRVKQREATTQMAIIKSIRLSNNCHQEAENRLMSIDY